MKRLLTLLLLAAGSASGQIDNPPSSVNIVDATATGRAVLTATNAAAAATAIGLGTSNDVIFNRVQIGGASFTADNFAGGNFQVTASHALTFASGGDPALTRTNLGLGGTNSATFGNVILNNDGNLAPAQTAASGDSLMTRGLTDDRYGDFRNTTEINNFTGLTAGQVSGGSTGIFSAHVAMRAAAGGNSFRSFQTVYMGSLNGLYGTIDAGSRSSRALVSQFADSRAFAAFYPLLGTVSTQWAGRGIGVHANPGVVPYWLYFDGEWRAMKASNVRGSSSVFPVRSNNIITIECTGAHNLTTNDFVSVAGVFPVNMQTYRAAVLSVPTTDTFTYENVGINATGTTILGDFMNIQKIEQLGSVSVEVATNSLFAGNMTRELRVDVATNGTATFFHNGTNVATGTNFTVTAVGNAARVGFAVETATNATTVSDFNILKFRHTINP